MNNQTNNQQQQPLSSQVKKLEFEQTPQAWDNAAKDYSEMIEETGFTRLYCIDSLDLTIPEGSIPRNVRILDIAAGSGALSIAAAQRVKSVNGSVVATDFSPEMIRHLKQAVERITKSTVTTTNESDGDRSLPLEALVMDGMSLEFPDCQFDYVYTAFAAVFFPDMKKAFSEMYRVLKDDCSAKATIVTWSPNKSPVSETMASTMSRLYRETGTEPIKIESPAFMKLSDPVFFESLLREVGFKNVTVIQKQHTFNTQIEKFVSYGKGNPAHNNMLSKLPEVIRSKYDQVFAEVLYEKFPNGNVAIESVANIIIAEK